MTKAAGNRGGGRRSLGASVQRGPTVQRSIRIPNELWDTLVFAARAAGVSTSEYIRDAVLAKLAAEYIRDAVLAKLAADRADKKANR